MGMRFARLRNIVLEERYARAPRYGVIIKTEDRS